MNTNMYIDDKWVILGVYRDFLMELKEASGLYKQSPHLSL